MPDLPVGQSETSKSKRPTYVHMPTLLSSVFGMPRSEARRCITQGAVALGGYPVTDLDIPAELLGPGEELTVGARRAYVEQQLEDTTERDGDNGDCRVR